MLTLETREGRNTSRQSRESHGETRSTLLSLSVLRGCVGVDVKRHVFYLAQTLRAQATPFAHTQGACSQRRCGESPRSNLQRVSSEDCRTPFRGQAVKLSAEMRSAFHSPNDVVGKVTV